jgi:beta-glucanase (GH16 family)
MNNRFNKMLPIAGGIAMALLGGCGGGETKTSAVVEPFYPEPQEEWRLVWSDEFDGTEVDTSKWGFQLGDGSSEGLTQWGNGELQWYTAENATVADGNLVISARAEVPAVDGAENFNYTSARLRTLGKYDFKYGRVEARIKAPEGQGLWSAFWMLPSDSTYGTWASSGEIDIIEAVNQGTANSLTAGTVHHGFQWPLNQLNNAELDVDMSDGFHVVAVEWEED